MNDCFEISYLKLSCQIVETKTLKRSSFCHKSVLNILSKRLVNLSNLSLCTLYACTSFHFSSQLEQPKMSPDIAMCSVGGINYSWLRTAGLNRLENRSYNTNWYDSKRWRDRTQKVGGYFWWCFFPPQGLTAQNFEFVLF